MIGGRRGREGEEREEEGEKEKRKNAIRVFGETFGRRQKDPRLDSSYRGFHL